MAAEKYYLPSLLALVHDNVVWVSCYYKKNSIVFRLNDELRSEYKQQSERFDNMRIKYDEKFSILQEENKRLQEAIPAETSD